VPHRAGAKAPALFIGTPRMFDSLEVQVQIRKRECRRVSFPHCSDWPSRGWQSTIGSLIIISGLYGPNGYRRMEREALESILKQILGGTIIYR